MHGVADQAPGDTVRAFVGLMVAAGGRDGAHYQSRGSELFTLAVPVPAQMSEQMSEQMHEQTPAQPPEQTPTQTPALTPWPVRP